METILSAAELIGSLGAILAVIIGGYKIFDGNKRQNAKQNESIESMQKELTVICCGLMGCLEGLIEQGCDGPCKAALAELKAHLNQSAHQTDLE